MQLLASHLFLMIYLVPAHRYDTHGMTIGELARMFNDRFGIGAQLEVVLMDGWTRDVLGRHAAAVNHPVAEYADGGYGESVSGAGAGRGGAAVRGAGPPGRSSSPACRASTRTSSRAS
jgi:hypothetical protein